MAEQNSVFRGPTTQEAFYAEKARFWDGLNKAIMGAVIFMAVLLIALAALL